MDSIDELERRFQNEMGWGPIAKEVFDRLRIMDEVLQSIASCQVHVPSDVVHLARQTVAFAGSDAQST